MAHPDNNSKTEEKKVTTEPTPEEEGEILKWTCHPFRQRPWMAILVGLFISVISVSIYHWTEQRWFGVFSAVVLFASLAKFYFPTTYQLSDLRISVKTTTQTLHKEWSLYRSCWPDKNGVLLSTFAGASRLENFRGLYLLFNNNRDEVVAFIEARLNRDTEVAESNKTDMEPS